MKLEQLRYFLTVMEAGSVTRAAATLHVAQPAVGRQIALLEDELGVRLFDRSPKGVTPTDGGRRLAAHAENILRQVEMARVDLTRLGRSPEGEVSIGLPTSMVEIMSGLLFQRVRERYPDVKLVVREGLSTTTLRNLSEGLVDLAILPQTKDTAYLSVIPTHTQNLFFCGPAGAQGESTEPIDVAEALSYPLVLPMRPNVIRQQIEAIANKKRKRLKVIAEGGSSTTITNLILAGGHSIRPWTPSYSHLIAGRVFMRKLVNPELTRNMALAWMHSRPLTYAAEAIREIMMETVIQLQAEGAIEGRIF